MGRDGARALVALFLEDAARARDEAETARAAGDSFGFALASGRASAKFGCALTIAIRFGISDGVPASLDALPPAPTAKAA